MSEDGSKIVSGSRDGAVIVWDVQKGEMVRTSILGDIPSIDHVDINADGGRVVSGSGGRTIRKLEHETR